MIQNEPTLNYEETIRVLEDFALQTYQMLGRNTELSQEERDDLMIRAVFMVSTDPTTEGDELVFLDRRGQLRVVISLARHYRSSVLAVQKQHNPVRETKDYRQSCHYLEDELAEQREKLKDAREVNDPESLLLASLFFILLESQDPIMADGRILDVHAAYELFMEELLDELVELPDNVIRFPRER